MQNLPRPSGKILSRQPVFRRNPKTQRIVLTGLLLTCLDSLSVPICLNRHGEWRATLLSETDRKNYLISVPGRGLRPVPRGTML